MGASEKRAVSPNSRRTPKCAKKATEGGRSVGSTGSEAISPRLRRFFEPQLEQLGMSPAECRGGVFATGENEIGKGSLWALELSESCLVVAHEVTFSSCFTLEEESPRSLCMASLSRAGVALCPFRQGGIPLRQSENVAVFEQETGTVNHLSPHDSFDSIGVCATPDFFDDLAVRFGEQLARQSHALMGTPGGVVMGGSEPYLRAALRFVGAMRDGSASTRRMLARRVEGMVALLAEENGEMHKAAAERGRMANVSLASQVRCLIEADPANAPSVEDMASLFSVSRARLCAVFKQEMGESVGAFATRKRIELSCALLEGTDLSVAQVAEAVGYRHQSSFADAFHRAMGASPREWRIRARGR